MQSSVYSKLTILKGNFTFSESSELYIEIQLGVILNLVWKLHSYVGYTIFLWFRTSWWYPLFVTFFSECMLFMSWDELSFVYIEFHRIFECHQSFFFSFFFFFVRKLKTESYFQTWTIFYGWISLWKFLLRVQYRWYLQCSCDMMIRFLLGHILDLRTFRGNQKFMLKPGPEFVKA